MAVILVGLTTVKELAAVPPKLTDVIPLKLLPVIVTVLPFVADVGEKEDTAGTASGVPTYRGLSHSPLP